ncbi:F-box/kelch-repeat protein [Dorcoceras hygrometricum]|uniref:F-box/kelch-repeat protein n=1 Tax=Dorcoceras hygrometricum TaxID=472368 RepID=A0A2Z7C1V5_9LAMI|nr:F-box/kelch-repeat protein [Dorcoceras hygrometricum]
MPPHLETQMTNNENCLRRSKSLGALLGDAGDEVCVSPDIYHCCKSCARKRQTRYIPQHLFFEILSHLPGRVLLDEMRHVCGEWNLMISDPDFIRHHLRNSIRGIIIQELCSPDVVSYVEMRRGRLEISKFDWGLRDVVRSSCNGLVLAPNFRNIDILYVINPLTKWSIVLPPYFGLMKSHVYFRLAFAEASMVYKVVHARDHNMFPGAPKIAILTLGIDRRWRHIDINHLSLTSRAALMSSPMVTGVYIHWIAETFVLTLNVETETICEFPLPQLETKVRRFLPMGSNLSIVSEFSECFRDVWEMNPETGKWVYLLRFDLRPLNYKFPDLFPKYVNKIVPFGWLEFRKVLLFSTSCTQSCCVAFNVETGEIQSFILGMGSEEPHSFQAHVDSLVWLG